MKTIAPYLFTGGYATYSAGDLVRRREASRSKNLCLGCYWYSREGKCIKPADEGWCRITRSI